MVGTGTSVGGHETELVVVTGLVMVHGQSVMVRVVACEAVSRLLFSSDRRWMLVAMSEARG